MKPGYSPEEMAGDFQRENNRFAAAAASTTGGSENAGQGLRIMQNMAEAGRLRYAFDEPMPAADYRPVGDDEYARLPSARYATVQRGNTLEGITGGDRELMGRYIAGTGLDNPNMLQAGRPLVANWDMGSEDAKALATRFYAADGQARADNAAQLFGDSEASTRSNPYGLSQSQMQAVARQQFGTIPFGGFDTGPQEPSAFQRLIGSFELSAKSLWNGFGAQAVAGVAGLASSPFLGIEAGDMVRATQGALTLAPSTEGGKYMADWLHGSALVRGLETLKTNTGNYYANEYGPAAGALGYAAPDALLMLLPAAPKALGSVGRAGLSYGFNALPEAAANSLLRLSAAVDSALYSLNPLNYDWGIGSGAITRSGFGPLGLKTSGAVEVRVPIWATPAQLAQYAEYTAAANEALEAGYLSTSGRVGTKGALRELASESAAAERSVAAAQGRPYNGVVGHGPDTTWTGKPDAFRWIDQDYRVNSSLGGQANRYPLGYKPTKFVLVGG